MTAVRDREIMAEAVRLGHVYKGRTAPNPAVGAVVVRNGEIVGRGAHHRAGEPHAETVALAQAGERAKGATLYVTLEPCAHHGRTPPCAGVVATAGISRVVIGTLDPNPAVAGKGAALLAAAAIDVIVGVHEKRSRHLVEDFASAVVRGRPWITAKYAMSLDGKLATRAGDSRWITGESARRFAHQLRSEHGAVIVGQRTIVRDDPRLTVRLEGSSPAHGPVRIVVAAGGDLPPAAALWEKATPPVWVACTDDIPRSAAKRLKKLGAEIIRCDGSRGKVSLPSLLHNLAARGITSVLVEGGGELLGGFFDARLVDRVVAFVAPVVVGGRGAVPAVGGRGSGSIAGACRLRDVTRRRYGDDVCIDGYVTDVNELFACVVAQTREFKRARRRQTT
jgi:diaminohydroxyphosphoribosylaminopyrimidine deaminase/5-amino-6-(5-phosphoribosylamino)uracil reductase